MNHLHIVAWSTFVSRHIPSILSCSNREKFALQFGCLAVRDRRLTRTCLKSPTRHVNVQHFLSFFSVFFCFFASICPFLHLSLYVCLASGQSSCLLQRHCGVCVAVAMPQVMPAALFPDVNNMDPPRWKHHPRRPSVYTGENSLSVIIMDLLWLHVCDKQRERY